MLIPSLSLHHLTAMAWPVARLAEAAVANGCSHVCLFGQVPDAYRERYPMARESDRAVLDAAGLRVAAIEVFALDDWPDWQAIEAAVELASALGAMVLNTHVHTRDHASAARQLARLVRLAEPGGLRVGIECNPFSQVTDLAQAVTLARDVGCEAIVDTLHVLRSGGLPDGETPEGLPVRYLQLSDAPPEPPDGSRWKEAMGGRMVPGAGTLPLVPLLSALPQVDLVSIEVPDRSVSPDGLADHVAKAAAGARAVLAAVQSGRNSSRASPS